MSLNNWHRVHVLLNTLTFRVGYGVDRRRLHYIYLIPQVFLNIKQIISGLRVQLMEVCFDSAYKLKPRLKQRMHMGYISQFIIRLIFEEWKPTPFIHSADTGLTPMSWRGAVCPARPHLSRCLCCYLYYKHSFNTRMLFNIIQV